MLAAEQALPSVSVVIPAFNAQRTLAATLDSVVTQTYPATEVFVVDDGSSDGTVELARRYRDRLPQLEVVPAPHGGISRTRNRGIRLATGTLVAPLDADDLWHPTYLEKMARRYRDAPHEPSFVYCGSRRVDLDGRIFATMPTYDVHGPAFYRMLMRNFVGNGSGMLFSRRLALALGLYDETRAGNEDIHLQLKLAWHGPIADVGECLVGYRDVPGSVSKRLMNMALDLVHMNDQLDREFPGIDPEAVRLARAQAHVHLAKVHMFHRGGNPLQAPRHLAKALSYQPVYLPARTLAVAARTLGEQRLPYRETSHPLFVASDPADNINPEVRFGGKFARWAALDARHVFPPLPASA